MSFSLIQIGAGERTLRFLVIVSYLNATVEYFEVDIAAETLSQPTTSVRTGRSSMGGAFLDGQIDKF